MDIMDIMANVLETVLDLNMSALRHIVAAFAVSAITILFFPLCLVLSRLELLLTTPMRMLMLHLYSPLGPLDHRRNDRHKKLLVACEFVFRLVSGYLPAMVLSRIPVPGLPCSLYNLDRYLVGGFLVWVDPLALPSVGGPEVITGSVRLWFILKCCLMIVPVMVQGTTISSNFNAGIDRIEEEQHRFEHAVQVALQEVEALQASGLVLGDEIHSAEWFQYLCSDVYKMHLLQEAELRWRDKFYGAEVLGLLCSRLIKMSWFVTEMLIGMLWSAGQRGRLFSGVYHITRIILLLYRGTWDPMWVQGMVSLNEVFAA